MSAGNHVHKWVLGSYVPEIYGSKEVRVGYKSFYIPSPEISQDAYSIFVCECGATKKVVHKKENRSKRGK